MEKILEKILQRASAAGQGKQRQDQDQRSNGRYCACGRMEFEPPFDHHIVFPF
jgi:hypothetical protein